MCTAFLVSATLKESKLMLNPLMPPVFNTPAIAPRPSTVIDFVIVNAPKPPGSIILISPPVAVLLMAPANVLHGAVRLQGLRSSPTPETHVRGAWAWATNAHAKANIAMVRIRRVKLTLYISSPSEFWLGILELKTVKHSRRRFLRPLRGKEIEKSVKQFVRAA